MFVLKGKGCAPSFSCSCLRPVLVCREPAVVSLLGVPLLFFGGTEGLAGGFWLGAQLFC